MPNKTFLLPLSVMYKGLGTFALVMCVGSLCLLAGCDSFRKLAGRPTSEDIAAKREAIAAEERAHQARLDSLKKVEKALADSLELVDRIRHSGESFLPLEKLRGAKAYDVPFRYCIIVGAFSVPKNAERFAKQYKEAGYEPVTIPYGNAHTAVAICGTDSMAQIWESIQAFRKDRLCPKGVWILVNE